MSWDDIKARLAGNTRFQEAFEREYPFAEVALELVRLRVEHDLTQEQLAQLAGTTQSAISRAESGRQAISGMLLSKIAHAVNSRWRPVFELLTNPALKPEAVVKTSVAPARTYVTFAAQNPTSLSLGSRSPNVITLAIHSQAGEPSWFSEIERRLPNVYLGAASAPLTGPTILIGTTTAPEPSEVGGVGQHEEMWPFLFASRAG